MSQGGRDRAGEWGVERETETETREKMEKKNPQTRLWNNGYSQTVLYFVCAVTFQDFFLQVIILADRKMVLKVLLLWYNFLHILLVAIQLQRIHQFLACPLLLLEPPIKKRPY